MDENLAKKMAIASLICGCLVYVITMFASMQMVFSMFNDMDFDDPEQMSNNMGESFSRYFNMLDSFKIPIIAICAVGILTGVAELKAPKKQKGMAIAGLIMGFIYLVAHLFMISFYRNLIEEIPF